MYYISLLYSQIKKKRFDWLIRGPSKAVLDRQKGILDREIEGLLQLTNKKNDKNF